MPDPPPVNPMPPNAGAWRRTNPGTHTGCGRMAPRTGTHIEIGVCANVGGGRISTSKLWMLRELPAMMDCTWQCTNDAQVARRAARGQPVP